jgi:hypothetical protein
MRDGLMEDALAGTLEHAIDLQMFLELNLSPLDKKSKKSNGSHRHRNHGEETREEVLRVGN